MRLLSAVQVSRARNRLLAASRDGLVRVFDTTTGEPAMTMNFADRFRAAYYFLFDAAVSPDGGTVATAAADHKVHLWRNELGVGKQIDQIDFAFVPWKVAFSPDGTLLATVSLPGQNAKESLIQLWELSTGEEIARIPIGGRAETMLFSTDGRYLITAAAETNEPVRVWAIAESPLLARASFFRTLRAAAYSPDGRFVMATGATNGLVRSVGSGDVQATLPHNQQMQAVAFSPDGRMIATAAGREAFLWRDWERGRATPSPPIALEHAAEDLVFSPKGTFLAMSGYDDPNVRVLDVTAGGMVERARFALPCDPLDLAFTPDEQFLLAGCGEPAGTWIVTLAKPHPPRKLLVSGATVLAVSASGRSLLTGTGNSVRIWEDWSSQSPRPVGELRHDDSVTSISLGRDEQLVTTGSADDSARLWTFRTTDEVARISHATDVLSAVQAGRRVLTTSRDGKARAWTWHPDDMVAEACIRLTRNLTADEWRSYLPGETPRATCEALPLTN